MINLNDALRNIKQCFNDEALFYENNAENIAKKNLELLKKMSVLYLLGEIIFFLAISWVYHSTRLNSIGVSFVILQVGYCLHIGWYERRGNITLDGVTANAILFSLFINILIIGLSVYAFPNRPGIAFFPMLLCMALIYRMPSRITIGLLCIYASSFIFLSYFSKSYDMFTLDVFGTVLSFTIALCNVYANVKFNVADYKLKKELENLGSIDQLTQVLNKASITKACNAYFTRKENFTSATLFILDLDDFKQINDQYGHEQGDEVLRQFASIVKQTVGEIEEEYLIGRFGGDEFIVFIKNSANLEAIKQCGDEILRRMKKTIWHPMDQIAISCSIGIAVSMNLEEDYQALFNKADEALYHAKDKGKNTLSIICA